MNAPNQRQACRAVGLAEAGNAAIATEDFSIPSDTAGVDLHLRRKRLAHVEKFPGERTLLLMHGATCEGSASTATTLPCGTRVAKSMLMDPGPQPTSKIRKLDRRNGRTNAACVSAERLCMNETALGE
jgi:hypothetical protein